MSQQQESLKVPGRYDQIQQVCLFVSAGASRAGFGEDTLFRLELATDEACTNVIEHAYRGEDEGMLHVSWRIEEGDFVIEIRDQGHAFDPAEIPVPSLGPGGGDPSETEGDPISELKVGGLGLYFMRELMDGVTFRFDDSQGNVLTMTKHLPRTTPDQKLDETADGWKA